MGNIASEIGFGRGFDDYFDIFRHPDILAKRRHLNAAKEGLIHDIDQEIGLPRGEDINLFLLPWLSQGQGANSFSFVWSIETHVPYRAPRRFRRFAMNLKAHEGERQHIRSAGLADRQRIIDLYDDEIYYSDHCFGHLIEFLKSSGEYEDAFILVSGDHGDGFYEHGFYAHGTLPFEELSRVPLIVKFPGGRFAGQRISALVSLLDIFPTLIEMMQLEVPSVENFNLQGRNLLPLLTGAVDHVHENVFTETQSLEINNRYVSVRSSDHKYIRVRKAQQDNNRILKQFRHLLKRGMILDLLRSPQHFLRSYIRSSRNEYLFDLRVDEKEENNLAGSRRDLIERYRDILEEWERENEDLVRILGEEVYTIEEGRVLKEHLRNLGYE
jgi:arylsulfatase A-like enzyme